jgi:hypothetical protein
MFLGMSKVLPTDHMGIYPTVKQMADGSLCIRFEGGMFRTLRGKLFGLTLTPETTEEEAEAIAALLDKHCPYLFVASLDHDGLSEEERLSLTRMYDEMGLLGPEGEENEEDEEDELPAYGTGPLGRN